jgi:perosamine synthetase
MKIHRTLPPAAAPIALGDVLKGLTGVSGDERHLKRLEDELRAYFGVKHVFLLSSGKAALTIILEALKTLSDRTKVVIPAYTCFSVPSAIVKAGLHVDICDVDPQSLDFNEDQLKSVVEDSPLCIVPTHLFGKSVDIERVTRLCHKRGIFVVEDAAQAMGGRRGSKLLGTLGDVGFFSLARGKNLTCGSGGIIVTNSDAIAGAITPLYEKLHSDRLVRTMTNLCEVLLMGWLIHPWWYWLPAGLPFLKLGETKFSTDFETRRMDSIRARLLVSWRRRLESANHLRSHAVAAFLSLIPSSLKGIQLSTCHESPNIRLPLLLETKEAKEELCRQSKVLGLGISAAYPNAVSAIPELQGQLKDRTCQGAMVLAERLVTLPVHQFVTDRDRRRIIDAVYNVSRVVNNPIKMPSMPRIVSSSSI